MYKSIIFITLFFANSVANAQFGGLIKDLSSIADSVKKTQATPSSSEAPSLPAAKTKAEESAPLRKTEKDSTPVEFPSELLGKYAPGINKKACAELKKAEKATDVWTGISIGKTQSQYENIICIPSKIDFKNGIYSAPESCENMGEEWKTNATYKLSGDILEIKYNDKSQSFVLCERPKVVVSCGKDELSVFENTTGKKDMAICAYPKQAPFSKIEYRYGPKEGAEIIYLADQKNKNKFYVTTESIDRNSAITYIWFTIGEMSYAAIECNSGCGPGGIVVTKGKNVLSKQKFTENLKGTLLESSGIFSFDSNNKFTTKTNLIEEKYFPVESAPGSLFGK